MTCGVIRSRRLPRGSEMGMQDASRDLTVRLGDIACGRLIWGLALNMNREALFKTFERIKGVIKGWADLCFVVGLSIEVGRCRDLSVSDCHRQSPEA